MSEENRARGGRTPFPSRSDIRAQSAVLCACLAVVALVDWSTPGPLDRSGQIKGPDFIGFYVLGAVARDRGVQALYDPATERSAQARLIPEAEGVQYLPVYGPQVYLFFSPFAAWPYERALFAWTFASALLYAGCCALMWRRCPNLRNDRTTVALVALASPALFNLLLHGQSSALALAFLTFTYIALENRKPFVAGLALGMLAYKPQLGIAAAAVFVVCREWRVIAGAMVTATAQLGIAWTYFGTELMRSYAHAMATIGRIDNLLAIKPYQMHSLFAFWKLLVPSEPTAFALYLVSAIAVTALAIVAWRSPAPLPLRFSVLLLATALASPHLYVYDLVILAPAFLLTTDWALGHRDTRLARRIQLLLYACYALPLLGVAAQVTHVQFSVIATAALTGLLASAATKPASAAGWQMSPF